MVRTDPALPSIHSEWIEKVIFLGTGTSGQVPAIHCLLPAKGETGDNRQECSACLDAIQPKSKNRRGCTSALIVGKKTGTASSVNQSESQSSKYPSAILIDCGPTFYSSAIQHFREHGLRTIDAVLLTHAHADAMLGLDNLRAWTLGGVIQESVDIYCTQECYDTVKSTFPYLVDSSRATGKFCKYS